MNRWRTRSARSAWWVSWLLAALLWLPLMGALHQVVHDGSPLPVLSGATVDRAGAGAQDAEPARSHASAKLFAALFSAHGSDADCQVFDQLSHGASLIGVAAPGLPALPQVGYSGWRLPAPPGLANTAPQARGPPELA